MDKPADSSFGSFRRVLLFWFGLILLMQLAERWFLLPEALSIETPTAETLGNMLITGLRADLITTTLSILCAGSLAWLAARILVAFPGRRGRTSRTLLYRRSAMVFSSVLAGVFFVLLAVNMGYYYYNHRYLDFAFFEFLHDLWQPGPGPSSQASLQAGAELDEVRKWALRLTGYLALQAAVIFAWWGAFKRLITLNLPGRHSACTVNVATVLGLVGGLTGFHPSGPWAVPRASIASSTYYTLAQNPVWYGSEGLLGAFGSGLSGTVSELLRTMPLDEAVRETRLALAPGSEFRESRYPLVRELPVGQERPFGRPTNVLLIFIEGLDRRYLGRCLDPDRSADFDRWFIYRSPQYHRHEEPSDASARTVCVTPFLDRFKDDSLFFENFFANGTQTARGLFATLCSYYPRQGSAAMKTRYLSDYLCLPSLLGKAGYKTEMVVGQNRDRNLDHIGLFLARNGVDRMLDESDFPPTAEKLGVGVTDEALFAFLRGRLQMLQAADRPFFLATLTVSTHHPYTVPLRHPEVRLLQQHADRYVAALRYLDLEFERFFTGLERDGLLKHTVVFILGDHGRHHGSGRTEPERWAGHFTVPLFIWMDPALRTPDTFRPRTVSTIAGQVDLTPTILGMNGLTPRIAPFLGRDLGCIFASDCLQDNFTFLTSASDHVIGLADREGIWFYSFRDGTMHWNDPRFFHEGAALRAPGDPDVASKLRRMLALYVSSNVLLEQNRIWSWDDLRHRL